MFFKLSLLYDPSRTLPTIERGFNDCGVGLKRLELSSCYKRSRQTSASTVAVASAAYTYLLATVCLYLYPPPLPLLHFLRRPTTKARPRPSASATTPPEKTDEGIA